MLDIHKEIGELESELIHLRERFHQYPELACREKKTTEMIIEELIRLHIPYERLEPTGVVGYLGKRGGKTVALRADIDGLAVTEETGLSFQSKISGQMHACGHDGHMAILLSYAKWASDNLDELENNIKSKFKNVGIEIIKCTIDVELDTTKKNAGIHSIDVKVKNVDDEQKISKIKQEIIEEYEISEDKIKIIIK